MDDPARRPTLMKRLRIAAAVALVGAGVGAYFALRPTPQPDYLKDGLDSVFNYTLLTDDFNKLPVEKRLELMGLLIQRLKGMNAQDSMLLAAFASGIAGSARAQIEKNMSILVVDMWDKYATTYDDVPPEKRGEYIDKTVVDMMKMMEAAGGQARDITDDQRIAEVRTQAKRDKAMMSDGSLAPDARSLGGMFSFINTNLGGRTNPAQKARGGLLMRDMARHFREDK